MILGALLPGIDDGEAASGPRLFAFFGVIYYAALRPAEAVNLRKDNVILPPLAWNEAAGTWEEPTDNWGELRFSSAAPEVGAEWTDDGARREHRRLKARAEGEWRHVPIAPPLTRLMRRHFWLVGSVLLLVLAVALGVVAIWDVGGLVTTMRARLDAMPMLGASYRRLPSWAFRAFGVWCIVFGIGQLIFVYDIMHGASH